MLQFLAHAGLLETGLKVRPMVLPDRFLNHDAPLAQYDDAGLNASHIVAQVLAAMGVSAAQASSWLSTIQTGLTVLSMPNAWTRRHLKR